MTNNEFWILSRQEFYLALITFGILLLSTFLYLLWRKLSIKGNSIVIVGLSGSGKTAIFSRLINISKFKKFIDKVAENKWNTYTSLKENNYDYYVLKTGKNCSLIDYPGAESLRKNLFLRWFKNGQRDLKGIIFVIDSSDFNKRSKDVAEFLYDVLYETGKNVPVLIACNKQNIEGAADWQTIRKSLEKEFGLINKTREAALSLTSGDSTKRLLTLSGTDFSWKQLKKVPIFEECIAESDSMDEIVLEPLKNWICNL